MYCVGKPQAGSSLRFHSQIPKAQKHKYPAYFGFFEQLQLERRNDFSSR